MEKGGSVYRPKDRHGKETAWYWLRYPVPGQRQWKREVTNPRTDDEAEAYRQLRARQAEHPLAQRRRITAESVTVNELMDLFVADYRRAGQSFQAERVLVWRHFLGDVRAAEVQRAHVEALCDEWRRVGVQFPGRDPKRVQPISGTTCNRYVSALRRAFSLGREHYQLLTPLLFPHSGERKRKHHVSPAKWAAIGAVLERGGGAGVVFARLIELSVVYGIRKEMSLLAQPRHIHPETDSKWIFLVPAEETKNGDPYRVPLVGRALEIFKDAYHSRPLTCPYLFHCNGKKLPDPRQRLQSACAELGVPYGRKAGMVWHDLRHSAITTFNALGVPPAVGMALVGHRDLGTYVGYDATQDDVLVDTLLRAEAYVKQKIELEPFTPITRLADARKKKERIDKPHTRRQERKGGGGEDGCERPLSDSPPPAAARAGGARDKSRDGRRHDLDD